MRVGGEDPVGGCVEDEIDRLLADRDPRDRRERFEIDDGHPVAARACDIGAAPGEVDADALGIEADRDRGDLPRVRRDVYPAGRSDAEALEGIRRGHRVM